MLCTGARRIGSRLSGVFHTGAAPGVQAAAWRAAEEVAGSVGGPLTVGSDAAGVEAGRADRAESGSAEVGPAAGASGVRAPMIVSLVLTGSKDPPCAVAARNITADPANAAPRVRDVGRQVGREWDG